MAGGDTAAATALVNTPGGLKLIRGWVGDVRISNQTLLYLGCVCP
jgi:hypothetical protein